MVSALYLSPSLRAKRSNPEARKQELDCFVASLLAMTTSLHPWQHFELVKWRRRGQRPFQRGGAGAPRIVSRPLFPDKGHRDTVDEDQHAKPGQIGPERGHQVPAREGVRIVDIAPRHARQA